MPSAVINEAPIRLTARESSISARAEQPAPQVPARKATPRPVAPKQQQKQQPQPQQPAQQAPAAPAPADQQAGGAPAEQPPVVYSPWTKFCGKDNAQAKEVCLTV